MTHNLTWVAWKVGKGGFGLWHRSYDPDHRWSVCGKEPSGIIDLRKTAPRVEQECGTCRQRDALRVRAAHIHPFGGNY